VAVLYVAPFTNIQVQDAVLSVIKV